MLQKAILCIKAHLIIFVQCFLVPAGVLGCDALISPSAGATHLPHRTYAVPHLMLIRGNSLNGDKQASYTLGTHENMCFFLVKQLHIFCRCIAI